MKNGNKIDIHYNSGRLSHRFLIDLIQGALPPEYEEKIVLCETAPTDRM